MLWIGWLVWISNVLLPYRREGPVNCTTRTHLAPNHPKTSHHHSTRGTNTKRAQATTNGFLRHAHKTASLPRLILSPPLQKVGEGDDEEGNISDSQAPWLATRISSSFLSGVFTHRAPPFAFSTWAGSIGSVIPIGPGSSNLHAILHNKRKRICERFPHR
jgi:hypothetical protein